MEITREQMQTWFNTAREGGASLEDGEIEPAFSSLNSLADSIWMAAYRSGITLAAPPLGEEDDE